MPIESFSYISSLNSSNPGGSDGILQGDDHIRGIKAVLLASFPQIDAATTITPTVLNNLQAGTYSGAFSITGRLTANGACPTGMIADFLAVPSDWLELNGQAVSRTTYAALFALYGTTYGVGNGTTTFNLPNFADRYRRQRGTNVVGTLLANQNKTHTHTYSGSSTTGIENQTITHNFSGTTSTESSDHSHGGTTGSAGGHSHSGSTSDNGSHSHGYTQSFNQNQGGVASGGGLSVNSGQFGAGTDSGGSHSHSLFIDGVGDHQHGFSTGGVSANHNHSYSGTTGGQNQNHNHNFSWSGTTAADGGTEARPDTVVVITCVKT